MRFGLSSSSSLSGESFVDKHFRNASNTRKIMYAVTILIIIVIIILWITLSGSDEEVKYRGSSAIQDSPLVDGFGGFSWMLHTKLKDKIDGVDLTLPVVIDDQKKTLQTDLSRLKAGYVSAQFWEVTESCPTSTTTSPSTMNVILQLDLINRIVNAYPKLLRAGTSSNDVTNAFTEKKTAIYFGINGGHTMTKNLALLRTFVNLGVRFFTFNRYDCINYKDLMVDKEKQPELSEFAKVLISELNRLGVVIDLTGSNPDTQAAVLSTSKAPVIFSHSVSSKSATLNTAIKVDDEILKKLKTNRGVLLLNFDKVSLATEKGKEADISTVIQHLNYIKSIIGTENIGIGAGFDSSENYQPVLKGPELYPDLFDKLGDAAWSEAELKNFAGLNLLRVLRENEKVKESMANLKPFDYEEKTQPPTAAPNPNPGSN